MLSFYNTFTRKKEIFKSIGKKVGIYTCGPTVYNYAHVGNFRAYIFADLLVRYLKFRGYKTQWVMNITDVGHLLSDADTGLDKIEVAASREKKTAKEIALFYTKAFFDDAKKLNIDKPDITPKATDNIEEMIALIEKLQEKGFTYKIADGIYFDTSKFKNYGKLAKLDIKGIKAGARVDVVVGKKHPTDFALWKFSQAKRQMEWDSPWGVGFPGWHIECSAMSMEYLGDTFDIHTGGIDHIPVHHTNEIAQSEAATGKKFVKFWLHNEFLLIDNEKISKSKNNFLTISDLIKKGFDPIAFRYLCLQSHYRSKMNFSITALRAAENTLEEIRKLAIRGQRLAVSQKTKEKIIQALDDDLDMPKALAFLHEAQNYDLWLEFEPVLGLSLEHRDLSIEVSKEVKKLLEQREHLRNQGKFSDADKIRKEIKSRGYEIEDTDKGPRVVIDKLKNL